LLAKHGWNVAILEKEKFPRFKIGESLLPGSLCTFERMGVKEKIDQADVIVLDLYLKFVTAWYTQEFAEVFFHPKEFFQLVPAVNSVLAVSEQRTAEVRWRLWVFDFLVFLQKRFALIAPRMNLQPK
jgi:2-polyprenyl-6-methoxyphenol hydroxylase-like FAD-dependent oxidoreductase